MAENVNKKDLTKNVPEGNDKAASKEDSLKKQQRANLIRTTLPIIGLVAVAVIFNVLTKGGMPISGGAKARFLNVIIGALLYIVLTSGLTMMGLTTQAMQLVQGVVFLVFVAIFADRESLKVIK